MTNTVIIPTALQLCLDDVGWHDGRDMRYVGQPSRSGLPRNHSPLDYKILAELGKAIDMKILCPLCLGEWDKDNFLRGEVGITHKPHTWDRASEIDLEYTKEYFDALEGAEYIEYAIHGLMHGLYKEDGSMVWEHEYFYPETVNGKKLRRLDVSDLNRRLDLFFKIYDSWGFTKKIRAFVSPCGAGKLDDDSMLIMSDELAKRGVRFWTNGSLGFKGNMKTYGKVACMKKMGNFHGKEVPWEAYDFDPSHITDYGSEDNPLVSNVIGMHWTNFLRFHPENNLERLEVWVEYFRRQSEVFGAMLSKDISFTANQQYYRNNSSISFGEGKCEIDVSEALAKKNVPFENELYVSFKHGTSPVSCLGGGISLYEKHNSFDTYKIRHTDKKIILTLE